MCHRVMVGKNKIYQLQYIYLQFVISRTVSIQNTAFQS